MMDDIIQPGGSPRPRRQDILVKALSEDAPAAQHRIAVEPPHQNDQPNRLAGQRQIRQSPLISAVDPPRSRSASRTGTHDAQRTDGDERRIELTAGSSDNKAARNKARRSEDLAHGIDSFDETNATLVTMSSKLSQSQNWMPIEGQFWKPFDTMRIGGVLELGGEEHTFTRTKQRTNSLLNANGQPVSEMAISAHLAGLSRDAYETMFSLDDETLEAGGKS
jgi:hypothetical protein